LASLLLHSIIVIGAGVSGLTAAQKLTNPDHGLNVLVLEARDRIGGRTHTLEDERHGVHLDMGATWIHGAEDEDNPIVALAKKAKADFKLNDESTIIIDEYGNQISRKKIRKEKYRFHKLLRKAEKYTVDNDLEYQIGMKEAIQAVDPDALNDPIIQYLSKIYLEFDYGATLQDLSVINYNMDDDFDGEDAIPLDGYRSIVNHLARGLKIEKGCAVQTVRYNANCGVELDTNMGTFKARSTICTVPLGVLKSGDMRFEPALPKQKQNAIDRIGWGTVAKVGLLFEEPFWPKDEMSFGFAAQDGKFPFFLNKYCFTGTPMLETYAVGTHARRVEQQTKDEIIQDVMEEIHTMFGNNEEGVKIPSEPVCTYVSSWGTDPFSRGAYSFAGVATGEDDFELFEEPVNDVLLFAGEHTCQDFRGTVHGAHISGLRVAKQILKMLR
jgi:polyamine oxidase